jgi:hypothetical protein
VLDPAADLHQPLAQGRERPPRHSFGSASERRKLARL